MILAWLSRFKCNLWLQRFIILYLVFKQSICALYCMGYIYFTILYVLTIWYDRRLAAK